MNLFFLIQKHVHSHEQKNYVFLVAIWASFERIRDMLLLKQSFDIPERKISFYVKKFFILILSSCSTIHFIVFWGLKILFLSNHIEMFDSNLEYWNIKFYQMNWRLQKSYNVINIKQFLLLTCSVYYIFLQTLLDIRIIRYANDKWYDLQ